ncbi:MAG TPA: hypothetical protein DIT40_01135 [Alphaproteobacteria bacterium]|nr:hypothetical protein [Alphaproteobacteria bacterium]HCO89554.1 hypothetical protein [Alphaproteobacteria bacterium]
MAMLKPALATAHFQMPKNVQYYWIDWLIIIAVGLSFWKDVPDSILQITCAAAVGGILVHRFICAKFLPGKGREPAQGLLKWVQLASFAIAGAGWGYFLTSLYAFKTQSTEPVLLLATLVILGSWTLANIYARHALYLFIAAICAPLLSSVFLERDPYHLVIGSLMVALLFICLKHVHSLKSGWQSNLQESAQKEQEIKSSKELKALLEKDRARLQSILDAVPLPIIVSRNATGELLYMNRTTVETLALEEAGTSETIYTDFFVDPIDRHRLADEVARKGALSDVEVNLKRADGTGFWALYSASQILYDGTLAIIGVFVDISARRAAEQALQQSEAKFHLFAEHAKDIITTFDMRGICLFASPAIEEILGYTPAEFVGTEFQSYVHPDDIAATFANDFPQLSVIKPGANHVYRIRHKDGHWVWTETSASTEHDPETGKPTHLFAVSRNITDRILYEQELKAAREHTIAADRAKSEFLAHMSHEIRTPLNAVIGFSEIMRNEIYGKLGDPRYVEFMDDIHDSGTHLLQLINDVLDLSKIEAGKFELLEDRFAIAVIAETACRIIRERARVKNITIESLIDNNLYVWCDRRIMTQVLLNILGNAVKFTPDSGHITLRSEICPAGDLKIHIADNGIGISEEDLAKVMEPFGQANHSSTMPANDSGAGLGLALSRSLMEQHDGTLEIASKLNEGTTVTLSLPAARVVEYQTPKLVAMRS